MSNATLVDSLVKIADELDDMGMHREADKAEWILKRVAILSKIASNKEEDSFDDKPLDNNESNEDVVDRLFSAYKNLTQDEQDRLFQMIIESDEEEGSSDESALF